MKRYLFSMIMLLGLAMSCHNLNEASSPSSSNHGVLLASKKQVENPQGAVAASPDRFTHSVVHDAPYYVHGPHQATPPDGRLSVGTKVKLITSAGSYALVETANGIKAYISTKDMETLKH